MARAGSMGREVLRVGIIKDIGFTIVVVQEAESAPECCHLAGRSYAGGESILCRQAFNNLSPFKTIQLSSWERALPANARALLPKTTPSPVGAGSARECPCPSPENDAVPCGSELCPRMPVPFSRKRHRPLWERALPASARALLPKTTPSPVGASSARECPCPAAQDDAVPCGSGLCPRMAPPQSQGNTNPPAALCSWRRCSPTCFRFASLAAISAARSGVSSALTSLSRSVLRRCNRC
jgi:hypothetical protein